MSMVDSESFIAYGTYSGSDAFGSEGNAARAAYALNLTRAGYKVFSPANADAETSGGFVVRTDPVYPERHALCHSSAVPPDVSLGVSAGLKKKLPITDKQIIIGFSVFIPSDYVPNSAPSSVPVLRINATTDADAAWQAQAITLGSIKECFRVCDDLSLRWGTDAPQASKKLKVGNLNYLELRISATEVSAWIDDVFVMQKAVSVIPQAVAFIFENNINTGVGGTNMSGNPGRWALGNFYYMINDGIAPTVRLGPTTRVIGQRPTDDVDVRFDRPAAAPSNAAVAGQDLVDSPPWQLQSNTVGDFDTYSSDDVASGDAIRSMAMVHTVGVKVLASNLEPDPHNIKPYVKMAGSAEGADQKARDLLLMTGLPMNKTIRAMAIRPTDNTIWAVGDGETIFRSGPSQDISSWSTIRDTGSGVSYEDIFFETDGRALLIRSDNRTDWVLAGSEVINLGVSQNNLNPRRYTKGFDNTLFVQWNELSTTSSVSTTANPFTASPAQTNVGPSGSIVGGYANVRRGGSNRLVATINNALGEVMEATGSGSTAGNYTRRNHGDTSASFKAITWDGNQWLIGANSNDPALNGAPRIRRSTDLSAWAAVTAVGSNIAGGNQVLNNAVSNTVTHESFFFGDGGAMVGSEDGINWRQFPRLTDQALYAGVLLADGNFLFAGGSGVMLRTKLPGTDTTLVPMAGYTMAYGSSVFNPATAAPWTPEEAADAQFGVRLTS